MSSRNPRAKIPPQEPLMRLVDDIKMARFLHRLDQGVSRIDALRSLGFMADDGVKGELDSGAKA